MLTAGWNSAAFFQSGHQTSLLVSHCLQKHQIVDYLNSGIFLSGKLEALPKAAGSSRILSFSEPAANVTNRQADTYHDPWGFQEGFPVGLMLLNQYSIYSDTGLSEAAKTVAATFALLTA